MCGRVRFTLRPEQVASACGVGGPEAGPLPTVDLDRYQPSYNVSPGACLPVVAYRKEAGAGGDEGKDGEKHPVLHCMTWGLVPSFTKKTEKPDHYMMFNARSESIGEKASFRRLIPKNRCIVAAEGFYEWKKDGSRKQPYYIHFKDERPLVFAALYDSWQNAEGELLYTFTILTTCSSSALRWLHDRMPVILGNKSSIDLWINSPTSELYSVVGPYEGSDLVWYPVTPAMGKLAFDGPECIKEIKTPEKKPISQFFLKKIVNERQPGLDVQGIHCLPEPTKEEPGTETVKDEHGTENVNVKKEPGKIGHPDFPTALEDSERDNKCYVSQKIKGTEKYGAKRDYEQLLPSSRPAESTDDLKKKGRTVKQAASGQATLFSYFCRS